MPAYQNQLSQQLSRASVLTPHAAILVALLFALGFGSATAQDGDSLAPQLFVTRQGDTLSFRLDRGAVIDGGIWVLQSSANLRSWEDLLIFEDGAEALVSISQQDRWGHLFRARHLDADEPVLREFLTARSLWRSAGIDSYTIEVTRQASFFFWHGIVTVRSHEVISTETIDSNFFEPPEPRTIDDWFAHLKAAIDQKADRIDVTYAAVFGYTRSASINYSILIADEEQSWSILDFQPQR